MPAQSRCKACERFEARHENFCRVCGFEFRPEDDAPNAVTGIAVCFRREVLRALRLYARQLPLRRSPRPRSAHRRRLITELALEVVFPADDQFAGHRHAGGIDPLEAL